MCVTVPTSAQRMSASRGRKLEFGQPPPCMHTLKNGANLRKTSPNVESLPGERRASFASRDAVNILWSGTSCSTEPNICLKCASLSTLVWKKLRCCRGPQQVQRRAVIGRGAVPGLGPDDPRPALHEGYADKRPRRRGRVQVKRVHARVRRDYPRATTCGESQIS